MDTLVPQDAERVLLCDDELVVLTLDADGPWGRPLPTVDLSSVEDVGRAAVRGLRSLRMRGLISEEDVPAESLGLALSVHHRDPALIVGTVDDAHRLAALERYEVFALGGGRCVVVGSTVDGLHDFLACSVGVAAELMASVLAAQPPPGEDDGRGVALFLAEPEGGVACLSVVNGQGAEWAIHAGLDGHEPRVDAQRPVPGSPSEWRRLLMLVLNA